MFTEKGRPRTFTDGAPGRPLSASAEGGRDRSGARGTIAPRLLIDREPASRAQRPPASKAVAAVLARGVPLTRPEPEPPEVPAYLRDTYHWAYLNPRNVRLLDRELVVSVVLWGNHRRLRRAAFAELRPGQKVLQPAHVYGDFCPALARHLGSRGRLEVLDVARIQVAACRRKLRGLSQTRVRHADAARIGGEFYDAVCCYFLLHELPDDYKRAVVEGLLGSVVPGGKVIFVDYHRPHWAHPLRGLMSLVFYLLEPFAKDLWSNGIASYATHAENFIWLKRTFFGGLYQITVARRRMASEAEGRKLRTASSGRRLPG